MKRYTLIALSFIAAIAIVFAHNSEMHSHVPYEPIELSLLERIHGHVGPYVVLGALMGEHAIQQHDMPRYFGVTVTVKCPAAPPHSCLIDGLMASTGATMGKRNITLEDSEEIEVTIKDDESGEAVIYRLNDSIKNQLKKWERYGTSVDSRGKSVFDMKPESLFEIQTRP